MRFIQHHILYTRIPMKCESILPDEGFDPMPIVLGSDGHGIYDVYCKHIPLPGQRWGHRVIVICKCDKHVPFGRMGQHWKACPFNL